MKVNRIILSGGGTGGHIYPALAIYHQLKKENPGLECLYIGTDKGLESDIVPKVGLEFKAIEISGLKRSLSVDNLKVLWQMLSSTHKAKQVIRDFQPDVVIGTGGFVCAPVLYAASQLKIPTLIHEQNSVAGVTNKFLSRYVTRVATSFKEVHADFARVSDKVVYTGNPRGQEVNEYSSNPSILSEQFGLKDNQPTVLIFGGSRGAPAINKAAMELITTQATLPYQLIVATGKGHYEEGLTYLKNHNIHLPDNIRVVPYIDNMPAVFGKIDLVVSRSGATTLSEVTTLGLSSILIPSPYVTNNHQEKNAMALVNQGAAVMIREDELDGKKLKKEMDSLMLNVQALEQMAKIAKSIGTPHAIDDIIILLEDIV